MEAGTPDLIKLEDLEVGSGLTGRKHVLSLLVENKPGVLARIAGLFARRGFNIDTLAVGPTDDPDISRITLTLDGAVHPIDQVTKQLHKLVNVIKIRDMVPEQTVSREMALFRVQATVESRGEIIQFADIFRGKIVDVSRRSLTIEVTGSNEKIDAFERMIRPHGLIEMARTGEVAITRSRPDALAAALIEATAALDSLEALLAEAGGRRRLVSVTVPVELSDPSAAVFASRLAGDRWFCWEQPDRDGFALAALGSAHEVVSRGPERFRDLVVRLRGGGARATEPTSPMACPPAPARSGSEGWRSHPTAGAAPQWSSFPPALMVMPELALHRAAGRTHLTLCALAGPGVDPAASSRRLRARLAALREAPLPLADPHPTGEARIASVLAARALRASRWRRRWGGSAPATIEKVVLAREVVVEAPRAHDPAAIYGALREQFASCFCFCCGSPEAAFLGASPELLVRRSGAGAATVALAGSTRRSADPSVDDHLGEQLLRSAKDRREHQIVVRRIERTLRGQSVWVEAAPEPGLVKVANIQHLATPIHAQLVRAALRGRAGGTAAPDAGGGRGAPRRRAGRDRRARASSTAAGTPGRSAGWTPPRTASSASRFAPRCCATAPATCSRATASSPTPSPRPSSPRPRSSSGRCCRCSPARSTARQAP